MELGDSSFFLLFSHRHGRDARVTLKNLTHPLRSQFA